MSNYPVLWRQTSHGYDDDMEPTRQRDSYLYITEKGTIEGWQAPYLHPKPGEEYYGGIEIHSKLPLYDGQQPHPEPCQWTRGVCYHDGSSLAYDQIGPFFDSPSLVFAELAEWAESAFPKTVHDMTSPPRPVAAPDWRSLTEAAREAVETARAALEELARVWAAATPADEKEPVASADMIGQSRDLDAAGLLARPLPTRDEIARAMYEVLAPQYGDFGTPDDAADAVLALLEGRDGWL